MLENIAACLTWSDRERRMREKHKNGRVSKEAS